MKIYVAGPVWRQEARCRPDILPFLYRQIEAEAKLAGITVQIPYEEPELAGLEAREFAVEITRRIKMSDGMMVIFIPPDWPEVYSNSSVACEAQLGAQAGKPLVILADDPSQVPRLLRALASREPYAFNNIDFQQIFRDFASTPERERYRSR